jgi:hypothetical protein
MVIAPERAAPEFAATEYFTVLLPVSLVPVAIVIQLTWLAAVQAQCLAAATLRLSVPPADATVWDNGDTVVGQSEVPLCVTLTMLPATVTVPVRDEENGLGETE